MRVVYWKAGDNEGANGMARPRAADRVEAAKSAVMLDLALLKAEIECGMYKKLIAAIGEEIRYAPLPGVIRAVVIAAWQRRGLLPAATVERMVPEQPVAQSA